MKNRPTSSEIIQQAEQVIEEEKALSDPDLIFAYSYGYSLLRDHLQKLIDEETQEKRPDLDHDKLIKLIGQYGRHSLDSGVKGFITSERATSAFDLIEYVFSLTDGKKSPTIPTQDHENSTKS